MYVLPHRHVVNLQSSHLARAERWAVLMGSVCPACDAGYHLVNAVGT